MTAPRLPLLRSALALAVVLGVLAGAGVAQADPAGTATRTSGAVTATLTWKAAKFGTTGAHLTIVRGGVAAFDADLGSDDCNQCSFSLSGITSRTNPLTVADLDGDGEPEVVIDTYSGGAHCCYGDLVYRFDGTTYTHIDEVWGDVGATIKDLNGDGIPEFRTVADQFAYEFTDYADSYLPIDILDYKDGIFTDVTARFPALIRAEVKQLRRYIGEAHKDHGDLLGLDASYAADEDLLGGEATTTRFLARERKHGFLGTPREAAAYEAHLARFLKHYGYT
jgi:hypothetical protein